MSSEEEKLLKEAKKLPWDDRLFHKNWKVRNEANIDLAALCDSITDPKDPRLREFGKKCPGRLFLIMCDLVLRFLFSQFFCFVVLVRFIF